MATSFGIFCIVILTLILSYFLIIAFLNWRTGSRGLEIIPHREFFVNLPGNCANASDMVCHWFRLKTGRGRYQSAYEEL